MEKYDPKNIESKWQKYWESNKTFEVDEDKKKKKFYSLIEFPYPSGEGLHVGHPRPFTAMDVVSRKRRMEGYNVLYPIGFDAFGLPTENFAIKTGRPPAEVTTENIANFTRQLKELGYTFDWSRAVNTTDPSYYKWTQWIFLKLFQHGLAYKKNTPINWCPSCKIGLASEEVVNGKCERCGTPVERRDKEQWMLAITKYADKLLSGLETVDYIPQARTQQINWIGKSDGALVRFSVIASSDRVGTKQSRSISEPMNVGSETDGIATSPSASGGEAPRNDTFIEVFTTRPDTLFGATYMVLSPEHELVGKLKDNIKNWKEVDKYIDQASKKSDLERTELQKEKTGVELRGIKAINPVNNEEIPVWVADYVLASYGTGAIMAVPAHDERDHEFAKKFDLPIREVVVKKIGERNPKAIRRDGVAAVVIDKDNKVLVLRHKKYDEYRLPAGGYENDEDDITTLKREIVEETGYHNFEIEESLGQIEANFFAISRKEERIKLQRGYKVQLKSDDLKPTQFDEQEDFENYWFNVKEAVEKLSLEPGVFCGEVEFVKRAFDLEGQCFSGEGVSINSDFISGLETPEAKEKITSWLEERELGQRQVNYKLRDWVFSRQRYWGEPIPLVHCQACQDKKYKYVLLHGFTATSQSVFWPQVKAKLEAEGHTVYCPDLPDTDNPKIKEQAEFVLANTDLDENTVLVGHSHGVPLALHLLETAKKKVAKAVLLDGFVRPEFVDKKRPEVEASHDYKFDFKKIKNNAEEIVLLADDTFPIISQEQAKEMSELLDAPLQLAKARAEHFKSETEPEVVRVLENTGWIPLAEDQLPLELPKVDKYEPTDTGESPLAQVIDWVKTTCPQCGGPATRETDVMPNWAGSSWYFLRYCDPRNDKELASMEKLDYWMGQTPPQSPPSKGGEGDPPLLSRRGPGGGLVQGGVDWYNGGMEHTVLHLLYSRFWNQFLHDIGVVPTSEPYAKRTSHGLILAEDGEKMSKSRGNVVNPDEMIERFGADALRTYIMFMGPFDQAVAWSTKGLVGVHRFLERAWRLQSKLATSEGKNSQAQNPNTQSNSNDKDTNSELEFLLNKTIKKVGEDIEAMRFNTAVASLMELVNHLTKQEAVLPTHYSSLTKLLSPFAPHLSEELWHNLGNKDTIANEPWPEYDVSKIVEDTVTIAVQVNGKLRDTLEMAADASEADAQASALASEKIKKWLDGKEPKKVIYVAGKMVSIVV